MEKFVIDTSILVDRRAVELVEAGVIKGLVIIPEAVLSELQAQANFGKMSGFQGLEEIKKLRDISSEKDIKIVFLGERPTPEQIKLAKAGEIDNMIISIAEKEKAKLVTSDLVQHYVALAKGVDSIYLKAKKIEPKDTKIMSFFTPDTASVHLKEGVPPMVKRGKVGDLELVRIREEPMSESELREIAHEILEAARQDVDSSIEIERKGATVVQLRDIRIAIAERPFSDRMEITAVRPVAKLTIDEYGLSEELKRRFIEKQRGILIAGPPGAGKSTFAASVADYLLSHGFIVKTMESPRDLMVRDEVTQYAPLEGDMKLTADILLLVRPDYTIYDELRKTSDFQVFADMRMAGVGMIGVTHATRAIDAVQRLIGRVELGIIPQVVDTVIFINKGKVEKVYELKFRVKIPHGMTEEDLARPVIEVLDFETKEVEYEIYTYGEQVVVMPVKRGKEYLEEMKKRIVNSLKDIISKFEVDVVSEKKAIIKVREEEIPRIVGRRGRRIKVLERVLGVKLEVLPLLEKKEAYIEEGQKHWILHAEGFEGKKVRIYAGKNYLFAALVGSKGVIKIRKNKEAGKIIKEALMRGEKIYIA